MTGPGARVRLRGPEVDPLPADPLFVLTAWNPGGVDRDRAANDEAERVLEAELTGAGHTWWAADGRSPDDSWSEPGVAVARARSRCGVRAGGAVRPARGLRADRRRRARGPVRRRCRRTGAAPRRLMGAFRGTHRPRTVVTISHAGPAGPPKSVRFDLEQLDGRPATQPRGAVSIRRRSRSARCAERSPIISDRRPESGASRRSCAQLLCETFEANAGGNASPRLPHRANSPRLGGSVHYRRPPWTSTASWSC